MKILYISHKLPYPLSDGGKMRVFNHIKHLSGKNEVTSLSFIENEKELTGIGELRKYCSVETVLLPGYMSLFRSLLGLFSGKPLRVWYLKDRRFRKRAEELTKGSDLVIIQAVRMAQYAFKPDKAILDVVDTPSLQIRRALKHDRFLWRLIWALELPRIRRYEDYACRRFRNIIVASGDDREALGKGIVLKNGTELSDVKRKHPPGNNVMFLGNMEYPPNIDAVKYFVREIFPIVRERVRDAKFYIVGKNPGRVRKYASGNVIVTGFASDLGEYFSRCRVFAAPLRLGSGIQNKVLEAMNHELPVVTTSIVNKGIEAEEGKEIMTADNAGEFADKIILLLEDQKMGGMLSSDGKRFLRKNYSWEKVYRELDSIIRDA